MARLPQPEFALGLLLRTIRPSLSLDVKGDRGFVLDFFDRACDEKLLPGRLPESECSKNTIPAGWLRGIDRRDLNKIWNGKRPLPEDTARRILPAIGEQRIIALWRDTSTDDAIRDLALKLRKDGLQINKPIDVPKAVYVLIKEVVKSNAEGNDLLRDQGGDEKIVIPGVQTYPLSTGRISGNSLQIGTSSIAISPASPAPEELAPVEVYVQRALEAIAEKLGKEPVSFEQLKSLPGKYAKFLVRQRTHYWSAVGRHRNLQEIRPDDGDEQFERIKDDLDDFLETTWMSDAFPDGYERMLKTLGQASHYQVGGSVLTSIRDLFAASHKQGMTHMLVNEDRIEWSS